MPARVPFVAPTSHRLPFCSSSLLLLLSTPPAFHLAAHSTRSASCPASLKLSTLLLPPAPAHHVPLPADDHSRHCRRDRSVQWYWKSLLHCSRARWMDRRDVGSPPGRTPRDVQTSEGGQGRCQGYEGCRWGPQQAIRRRRVVCSCNAGVR